MNRRFDHRKGFSTGGLNIMRQRWRDLSTELRRDAQAVLAGEALDSVRELALRTALTRTGSASLPVEGESAAEIRNAFVAAGKALLIAAGERREPVARLALCACDCVDALLDEQARQAAAVWQRQFND